MVGLPGLLSVVADGEVRRIGCGGESGGVELGQMLNNATGDGTTITGWRDPLLNTTTTTSTTRPRTGTRSFRQFMQDASALAVLESDQSAGGGAGPYFAVSPGDAFVLRGWGSTDGGWTPQGRAVLTFYTSGGVPTRVESALGGLSGSYAEFIVTGIAPAGTAYLKAQFETVGAHVVGNIVRWDDLYLSALTPATTGRLRGYFDGRIWQEVCGDDTDTVTTAAATGWAWIDEPVVESDAFVVSWSTPGTFDPDRPVYINAYVYDADGFVTVFSGGVPGGIYYTGSYDFAPHLASGQFVRRVWLDYYAYSGDELNVLVWEVRHPDPAGTITVINPGVRHIDSIFYDVALGYWRFAWHRSDDPGTNDGLNTGLTWTLSDGTSHGTGRIYSDYGSPGDQMTGSSSAVYPVEATIGPASAPINERYLLDRRPIEIDLPSGVTVAVCMTPV